MKIQYAYYAIFKEITQLINSPVNNGLKAGNLNTFYSKAELIF